MTPRRDFLLACATLPILGALPMLRVVEVDWYNPATEHFRSCDICYDSASDDFMDGMMEPRAFYLTLDQWELTVCEHCLDEYLRNPNGD